MDVEANHRYTLDVKLQRYQLRWKVERSFVGMRKLRRIADYNRYPMHCFNDFMNLVCLVIPRERF